MFQEPVPAYYPTTVGAHIANPTFLENVDAQIKHHMDAIERLKKLKESLPKEFLNVNLRDLREAMNF